METIFDTQLEDIDVVDALREAGVEAPEAVYGACRKRAEEETCSSSSSSTEGCLSTGDAAALLLFTFSHGVLPAEHEEVRGLTPLDALNVGLAGGEYAKVRRLLWVMWRALRKLPHEYFSSLFVRIPVKVLSASDDEERAVKSAFLMTSPDAVSAAAAASATSATSPAQTPVSTTPNPSLLTLKESSSSGSVCSNTTATASRFLVKLTGFVSVYNLGKYSFFPDRQSTSIIAS